MTWKVGELARRTGVSVRTLHYYDEIGLLSPSQRTESGHRLYSRDDVVRLQQIRSLRRSGFTLEEIQDCLKSPAFSPRQVIQLHIQQRGEQIERLQRLHLHLEKIATRLDRVEEISSEEFIQIIGEMNMPQDISKYYTAEQLDYLDKRGKMLGEERVLQGESEWERLHAQVREAIEQGIDPADERVQLLAKHWLGLTREFSGGNAGIETALNRLREDRAKDDPEERERREYIKKAIRFLQGREQESL